MTAPGIWQASAPPSENGGGLKWVRVVGDSQPRAFLDRLDRGVSPLAGRAGFRMEVEFKLQIWNYFSRNGRWPGSGLDFFRPVR